MVRKFEVVPGFEDRGVILPMRSTQFSAGYDLSVIEDVILQPYHTYLIPTGVRAKMEHDDVLLIHTRSSSAKKLGLVLKNQTAVIDSDYYYADNFGHISLLLYNISNKPIHLYAGDRVAQGIFQKYLLADEDNFAGDVRTGGFGSTGESSVS